MELNIILFHHFMADGCSVFSHQALFIKAEFTMNYQHLTQSCTYSFLPLGTRHLFKIGKYFIVILQQCTTVQYSFTDYVTGQRAQRDRPLYKSFIVYQSIHLYWLKTSRNGSLCACLTSCAMCLMFFLPPKFGFIQCLPKTINKGDWSIYFVLYAQRHRPNQETPNVFTYLAKIKR